MRPSTIKRDRTIYTRWKSGEPTKEIMLALSLSPDEFYKAVARERKRRLGVPVYGRKRAKFG